MLNIHLVGNAQFVICFVQIMKIGKISTRLETIYREIIVKIINVVIRVNFFCNLCGCMCEARKQVYVGEV